MTSREKIVDEMKQSMIRLSMKEEDTVSMTIRLPVFIVMLRTLHISMTTSFLQEYQRVCVFVCLLFLYAQTAGPFLIKFDM